MKYAILILVTLLSSCSAHIYSDGSKSGQIDPSVGDKIYDYLNRKNKLNINSESGK